MEMVANTIMNDTTPPVCSICIANYNGEKVLIDCVDSVLIQQGNIPIEIIIHDDASTDNSIAILNERYPAANYPHIRLIERQENVGFCISNNRMAAIARGKYLLLLNNDAALAPDALEALVTTANEQSSQGILTLPQYNWDTGEIVDYGCLLDPFYNPVLNLDPMRRDVGMVSGACLWIPHNLWDELGGFPEWFESIGEDLQLCCHARLWGYTVQVTEKSWYRHRQGASFGGNRINNNKLVTTYRRRRLSERNKTYAIILCSPTFRLALTLPTHLILLAMEASFLSMIKWDTSPWREIYAPTFGNLLRHLKILLERRKAIQSGRKSTTHNYGKSFTRLPHKLSLLLRHGLPKLDK